MSRAIELSDLTDAEYVTYGDLVQAGRASEQDQFLHTVPIRDDAGVMNEVWFCHGDDPRPRASATIDVNGKIGFRTLS
jgi:hypothetical protein